MIFFFLFLKNGLGFLYFTHIPSQNNTHFTKSVCKFDLKPPAECVGLWKWLRACVCTCDPGSGFSQPLRTGETTLILHEQPTNDSQLKSLRLMQIWQFLSHQNSTLTQTTSGCLEVMIPFFGKVILVITSRAQQLLLCFVSQVRR